MDFSSENLPNRLPIRVLHICETAVGGPATYLNILNRLSREHIASGERAIDSKVILPDSHEDKIDSETPRRTFRYPGRSLGSLFRLTWAMIAERFRFRPDVVFCHSTFTLLALIILRPISPGVKFIYCSHGWAGAREMKSLGKKALVQKIEGSLCGLAHRVVNISQGDLDYAKAYGYRGQHIVIENAVWDVPATQEEMVFDTPQDAINLLFVGRFDRQKGVDILLQAFADASKKNPLLRLHMIGQPVLDKGKGQLEENAAEGVNFLGWIGADQINRYYRAADLLVVSSRWEGFGLVIPEALRNSTPVLVSDRCAIAGAIEPDISGWSCPLDIASFAEKLASLDKQKLNAMRPAARDLFLRRFHASRLGDEMHALYYELSSK